MSFVHWTNTHPLCWAPSPGGPGPHCSFFLSSCCADMSFPIRPTAHYQQEGDTKEEAWRQIHVCHRGSRGRASVCCATPTGTLLREKGRAVSNYSRTVALNWDSPWQTGMPGNLMQRVQGTGSGLKFTSPWGISALLRIKTLTEINRGPWVWPCLQPALWLAGPQLLPLLSLPCSNKPLKRGSPDKSTVSISCLLHFCRATALSLAREAHQPENE